MLDLDPIGADVDAWGSLARRASVANAFFEPELLQPAVRHLGAGGVRLLVAESGGEWIGLLPVQRAAKWRGMPASAFGTWMHPYCFFGAPLLAAGREAEAMDDLLGFMRRRTALVPLEYLPAEGAVSEAVDAALAADGVRPVVWGDFERAALHRRPEDDYVETTLASKRRRELRRQRKLMTAELGEVTCADEAGSDAALDAFLELESAGWKGRSGTALATADHAAFFRETCLAFRAAGRLQLVVLRAGGRMLSAQVNLISHDGVFCFKTAYDETLSVWSPGVQMQLDNVHLFHNRPELQWEDSCADPENQMINRLWPDRRRLTSLLVPGKGALGRVGRMQAGMALGVRNRRKEHA